MLLGTHVNYYMGPAGNPAPPITTISLLACPGVVDSPWPGYSSVWQGKMRIFCVIDSSIWRKSAGEAVFPGPPGKIVSPHIKYRAIRAIRGLAITDWLSPVLE